MPGVTKAVCHQVLEDALRRAVGQPWQILEGRAGLGPRGSRNGQCSMIFLFLQETGQKGQRIKQVTKPTTTAAARAEVAPPARARPWRAGWSSCPSSAQRGETGSVLTEKRCRLADPSRALAQVQSSIYTRSCMENIVPIIIYYMPNLKRLLSTALMKCDLEGWRVFFWERALGPVCFSEQRRHCSGLWPGSQPLWSITRNSVMEAITSSCERSRARKGAGKRSQTGVDSLLLFSFSYPQFGKMEMVSPLYPRGSKWKNTKTQIFRTHLFDPAKA